MTTAEYIDQQEAELFALLSELTSNETISPKQRESIDLRYGAVMDWERDPQSQLEMVREIYHQLELVKNA
jgi:hypothetical protein